MVILSLNWNELFIEVSHPTKEQVNISERKNKFASIVRSYPERKN